MPLFDWFLSAGGLAVTKAAETLTQETLKKWVTDRNANMAKKKLLNLYEQVSILENRSLAFVELLDDFIAHEQLRARKGRVFDGIESDYNTIVDNKKYSPISKPYRSLKRHQARGRIRRFEAWARAFTKRIEDVEQQMKIVSTTLQELNPQADIYLPEVTDFIKDYPANVLLEINFTTKVKALEIGVADQLIGTTLDELRTDRTKIKETVNALTKTKKDIAEFIRNELSFLESM